MKILFKAKHTSGARYMGSENVEYIGKSKIDNFPMFSYETKDEVNLLTVWNKFVFIGRPGYTPQISDFELIPSIEEPFAPKKGIVDRYSGKSITMVDDIVPVQPIPLPIGKIFYFDYVYENELDNRLLLML
jgi:hypothetical protein